MPLRRAVTDSIRVGGPGAERAAPGRVGLPDALEPDDPAAGRQVRPGHEPHQVVERGVRVGDQVPGGADHLDQVVRRHVGGHADGDAAGAVDQQVRQRGRQHLRLLVRVVVGRDEVDGRLVEAGGHQQGRGGQAGLGVARRGRTVVEGAEVAVAVDQRQPQRERLRHPDQRVVDRGVTVRVELAHHLADDPGALHVGAVRAQAHLGHRVEDPALHRLEAVTGVGQGPGVDDREGVLQVRPLHLLLDVDVDDALGEVLGGRWGTAGHAPIIAERGVSRRSGGVRRAEAALVGHLVQAPAAAFQAGDGRSGAG